ncbi:MAG: SufD family Fe-S cluster assembly protein, partial [Acidimicrobiia bacterium]|nr:SufD family Fe-S cluster assembly protein [Acidimicrobiia bacterium]
MPSTVPPAHFVMPDLSALSLDAARALPGPDGLRDRRAAAAERFTAEPLPTAEEEVWRYSRVADIDLVAMTPAPAPADPDAELPDRVEALLALAAAEDPAATVVVVDGHVVRLDVDPGWEAKGLVVGRPAVDGTSLDALGVGGRAPDAFALANDAFAPDPLVVDVPRVLDVTAPVVIVRWRTGAPGTVAFPRIVVRVGEAAAVAVLDVDLSAPGATGLALPVVELVAARGARLGYLGVQDLGLDAWQITTQLGDAGQEATLSSTAAVFGGAY